MTTTPTVWKAEFTANAGATAGVQFGPRTIGLADGRSLAVWVDDANNVDDDPGFDVIGRMFDAQGNAVGGAFQLNRTFFIDGESNPAIAALPNGGFIVVYEDNGSGAGGDADICFERFNPGGVYAGGGVIVDGTMGVATYSDPSIAILANGDYVVSYEEHLGGDTDVIARVVNGVTNAVGPVLSAAQNGPDADGPPDTVILSNGNILTAYEEVDGGSTTIETKIITTAGATISTDELAIGLHTRAAALSGGGFAVVWQSEGGNGDVYVAVRDNSNVAVKPGFVVGNAANDQNEPEIVALKDGGFFVVWDDDTADRLQGQRLSATGALIGTVVTITNGDGISQPELGLTDDGRILVTFIGDSDEMSQVILDPREKTIVGDNSAETITSRIDGATVSGNGGNDTLLGQAGVDVLNGGIGGDLMKGGQSNDIYWVDNGSDVVNETGGGAGIDTVNSSITFSLANTARAIGAIENLNLKGSANFAGTGNTLNNVITGNTGANVLSGGIGNDVLRGFGGADTLIGGHGIDNLTGGAQSDFFVLNAPLNSANRDVITDFTNIAGNNDTFRLENAVMPRLGAPGVLAASKFFAGTAAHDADDRIVYNRASGAVYYDSNGDTAGGSTLIAVIANKPLLTSADFVVI